MQPAWRGMVLLLGCFAGLCTLFAGLATGVDAWREHVRAGWPVTRAQVSRCEIREFRGSRTSYYIRFLFAYSVADRAVEARIDSKSVPDPARVIWHSRGSIELGDLQQWVDTHPAGTPIELHYNPARPQAAALVDTDMPLGGPQAAGDLRLVGVFGLPCAVLLLIGGLWPRHGPGTPRS